MATTLRHVDIVGLVQQLLYQLRSALAHRHRAERTVACMGIRAENHLSAACEHLPRELMNDCLMWRYIDTAVLFRAGQAKHVVILIDRSADRTQRVVAVGQYVRHRELSPGPTRAPSG